MFHPKHNHDFQSKFNPFTLCYSLWRQFIGYSTSKMNSVELSTYLCFRPSPIDCLHRLHVTTEPKQRNGRLPFFVRQMTTSMSLFPAEKCSQNLEMTLCSVLRYQTSSPVVTSWVGAIVLSQLPAVHNDAGSPGVDAGCWLPCFPDCLDASFVLHWAGVRLRNPSSDWFIPVWRWGSDWQDVDWRRYLLSVHRLSLEDWSPQSVPKSCHKKTNSKGIRCGTTEDCFIRTN